MDLGITGKTALVMSAGGGLGSAIALALAREGVNVAVSDRSEEALARTVARIRDAHGVANGYVADLGRLETLDELVASVTRDLGAPDILVNNTGGPAPSGVAGVPAQTWRSQFDAMVLSVMHLTDLVLPAIERGELLLVAEATPKQFAQLALARPTIKHHFDMHAIAPADATSLPGILALWADAVETADADDADAGDAEDYEEEEEEDEEGEDDDDGGSSEGD